MERETLDKVCIRLIKSIKDMEDIDPLDRIELIGNINNFLNFDDYLDNIRALNEVYKTNRLKELNNQTCVELKKEITDIAHERGMI